MYLCNWKELVLLLRNGTRQLLHVPAYFSLSKALLFNCWIPSASHDILLCIMALVLFVGFLFGTVFFPPWMWRERGFPPRLSRPLDSHRGTIAKKTSKNGCGKNIRMVAFSSSSPCDKISSIEAIRERERESEWPFRFASSDSVLPQFMQQATKLFLATTYLPDHVTNESAVYPVFDVTH